MAVQTYIGSRQDLEHYIGVSVVDHELALIDHDCNAIDLEQFEEVTLTMFEKKHGTELFQISSEGSPAGIEFGSPAGSLFFSIDYEAFELKEKPYFYEVLGIVGNEKQLLSFGVYLIG
jgi:hypothetical protein